MITVPSNHKCNLNVPCVESSDYFMPLSCGIDNFTIRINITLEKISRHTVRLTRISFVVQYRILKGKQFKRIISVELTYSLSLRLSRN